MSYINDGGQAFQGISLRDYFAGQALAGIYANRELQLAVILDAKKIEGFEPKMANAAYLAADAMLAARKNRSPA